MTDEEISELNDLFICADPKSFNDVHNFGEAVIARWPAICRGLRAANRLREMAELEAPDTLTDLEMLHLEGDT